jgi:hypothetical protein
MKRSFQTLVAAAGLAGLLLAGVGTSAAHATLRFVANLSGGAEVPPNASPGSGSVKVWFDPIAHTMRVLVDFQGLLAGNTAAHIHCCTVVSFVGNASVATTTPTFTGFPSGVTSGHYDHTFDMSLASSYNPSPTALLALNGNNTAAAEAALIAGAEAGKAYLNVHSSLFPGGEVRGYLRQVPEPATIALLGLGLITLPLVRRRKQQRA